MKLLEVLGLKTNPLPERVGKAFVWKKIPEGIELSPEFAREFFYGSENSGIGADFANAYEVELFPDWEDEGFRFEATNRKRLEGAEGVLYPDKFLLSSAFLEELRIASKNTLLLQSPIGKALPHPIGEALQRRKFTVRGYDEPWDLKGYYPENSAVATMALRAFLVERDYPTRGFDGALAKALKDDVFWAKWHSLVKTSIKTLNRKRESQPPRTKGARLDFR